MYLIDCLTCVLLPINRCDLIEGFAGLFMTSRLWSCRSLLEGVPLVAHNSMGTQDENIDLKERIRVIWLCHQYIKFIQSSLLPNYNMPPYTTTLERTCTSVRVKEPCCVLLYGYKRTNLIPPLVIPYSGFQGKDRCAASAVGFQGCEHHAGGAGTASRQLDHNYMWIMGYGYLYTKEPQLLQG